MDSKPQISNALAQLERAQLSGGRKLPKNHLQAKNQVVPLWMISRTLLCLLPFC